MATRFLHEAQRGASRGSIDLPLALLAGAALGFVAFVMPSDLLASVVQASGLDTVFAPARPPLGIKTHALIAAAAAGGASLVVYLLLRLLGRKPRRPHEREVERQYDPDFEPETPRLRRSDVHPDAPARRPILAARELGEPAPAPAPAAAPFWRPDDFPPEPEEERAAIEEELELNHPIVEEPEAAEAAAQPEPAPEPEQAGIEPATAAEPIEDTSIGDLMSRLERGLARRLEQKKLATGPEASTAIQPPAPAASVAANEDAGDDRLRSAIENLQRMAARAR